MSIRRSQQLDCIAFDGKQWSILSHTTDGTPIYVRAEAGMVVEYPDGTYGLLTGKVHTTGLETVPFVPTPFVSAGSRGNEIPFAGYTVDGFPYYPVQPDTLQTRRRRSVGQALRAANRNEHFVGKVLRLVVTGSFSFSSFAELFITYDDLSGIGIADNAFQMPTMTAVLVSGFTFGIVLRRKYKKYAWAEPGEPL